MYNVGETIQNRYRVQSILYGGMGIVYICDDQIEDQIVAIKTLQERFLTGIRGMERFVREARTWLALERHANIVHASKVEKIEGFPYIFMEYVAGDMLYGSSLRGWILHKGVTIDFALDAIIQICQGLSYAQSRVPGIVHRDLKPENILITQNKVVKVSDFGLVTIADEEHFIDHLPADERQESFHATLTHTGRIVGTPPYMSPEQCVVGGSIDWRSDIYTLGCILYELITGRWLMDSRAPSEWIQWHIQKPPISPSKINRNVPPYVDRIVLRCLEKKPDDRYVTFDQLASEVIEAYQRYTGSPYPQHALEEQLIVSIDDERMNRAGSYLLLRESERALEELDKVLVSKPNSVNAWIAKGTALIMLERHEESLSCLDKALELEPISVPARINKGLIYSRLGHTDRARGLLQEALELNPQALAAWVNLGVVYQELGSNKDALKCWDTALSIDPWSREGWVNRGNLLRAEGREAEANLSYRQAMLYSISFAERSELAFQLFQVGDILFQDGEIFEAAMSSVDRTPINVLLERLSNTERDAGVLKIGFGANLEILQRLPTFLIVYAKVTLLVSRLDFQLKSHRSQIDNSNLLDPVYSLITEWTGKYRSVDNHLLDGAVAFLHLMLALQLMASDQYELATKVFPQVLQLGLDLGTVWGAYGECLYFLKQWPEALECFEKSISRISEDDFKEIDLRWEILYMRGHILMNQGRLEEAVISFEQSLRYNPNNGETISLRDQCLKALTKLPQVPK